MNVPIGMVAVRRNRDPVVQEREGLRTRRRLFILRIAIIRYVAAPLHRATASRAGRKGNGKGEAPAGRAGASSGR